MGILQVMYIYTEMFTRCIFADGTHIPPSAGFVSDEKKYCLFSLAEKSLFYASVTFNRIKMFGIQYIYLQRLKH